MVQQSVHGQDARDVKALLAKEVDPGEAQAKAMKRHISKTNKERAFDLQFKADLLHYSIGDEDLDMEALKASNHSEQLVHDSIQVGLRGAYKSKYIHVTPRVKKIPYRRGGATISARHTMAVVKNVSKKPLAYYLNVASTETGNCEIRAARSHNAMALMPGEKTEIAVCAGAGGIEIRDLRIMEITPLGYRYLSKLPPQSIGHDKITQLSHDPGPKSALCTKVPIRALQQQLASNQMRWEDIVDYYSRHNCDHHQIVRDYRKREESVDELPISGPALR